MKMANIRDGFKQLPVAPRFGAEPKVFFFFEKIATGIS